jgi:hypothetical protein
MAQNEPLATPAHDQAQRFGDVRRQSADGLEHDLHVLFEGGVRVCSHQGAHTA